MSQAFHFPPLELPDGLSGLRLEVRSFLAEASEGWTGWDVGHSWTAFNRAFSKAVGERGWIGMTWPTEYRGRQRSVLERYVVVEELLAAGAPVAAHWVGDRQTGPLILRVGTEAQKKRFLPRIAAGDCAFCIGLSEPDSGSDLASIRSQATRIENGWRLNGRKLWTSFAHECDFMLGLFRTGGSRELAKHDGLSQFLIDLRSDGLQIRPIVDLTGEAHFNEVTFDDVFVPDDSLLGPEGNGWAQATAELSFERSGPDRYMSSFPLLPLAIDSVRRSGEVDRLAARRIGEALSDITILREMSISILGQLDSGATPAQEAALTKSLGTNFEQSLPDLVRELIDLEPIVDLENRLSCLQGYLIQAAPTYSIRGGTREIMRNIIARGLGLR